MMNSGKLTYIFFSSLQNYVYVVNVHEKTFKKNLVPTSFYVLPCFCKALQEKMFTDHVDVKKTRN